METKNKRNKSNRLELIIEIIILVILFMGQCCMIYFATTQPNHTTQDIEEEQCCGNGGINCVAVNENDVAIVCKTCNKCLSILPITIKEIPVEIIVEKEVIIETPVEIIVEKEVIVEVEKVINERCCDGVCMYSLKDNTFIFICMECGFQRIFENVVKAE